MSENKNTYVKMARAKTAWQKFVDEWRKKNPSVSFKESLKRASKEYKKSKK